MHWHTGVEDAYGERAGGSECIALHGIVPPLVASSSLCFGATNRSLRVARFCCLGVQHLGSWVGDSLSRLESNC